MLYNRSWWCDQYWGRGGTSLRSTKSACTSVKLTIVKDPGLFRSWNHFSGEIIGPHCCKVLITQLLLCSVITKYGHILAWRHGQFPKLFWIKRLGGLADKTVPTAACGARLKFMGSTAGLSHLNMMMIEVGHWLANLGSDRVPQFHGKWPFLRLGGMQEPVSSLIFPLTISIFTLRYLINYEEQLIALITFCVIGKRPSQLVKPGDQRLYDHLVHKKSFQPGCNVLGRFFSSPSVWHWVT